MGTLKDRLNDDLHSAMKSRDELTTSTLRMALSAVRTAETTGTQERDFADDEVVGVLAKEAKKRRDAAEAFASAGRAGQSAREQAEGEIIARYLPRQLTDDEIADLVATALQAGGFSTKAQIGPAMKAAQAAVAGRADGGRVAAAVRRQLS
jgi:uncharacterized protein YqeY